MSRIDISKSIFKVQYGQIWVNSVDVSQYYSKRHDDVLKAIRHLLDNEEVIGLGYFAESYYINSQNKEQPCYLMNRDGFMLLTMGFTGDKALKVKLGFIEAFNKMEAELLKPKQQVPTQPQLPSKEEAILRAAMMFGEIAETPKHILLTGVVKEIRRQTGTDLSFALEGAKALEDIKKEEMMLEPTELGRMFKEELGQFGFTHGNTGINANNFLAYKGVQSKNNGFWSANEGFEQYTFRNPWNSKTKEGYNLKWNIDFFRSLINN